MQLQRKFYPNVCNGRHRQRGPAMQEIVVSCKQCLSCGRVSLLTVPLMDYRNAKIVNCLFSKTTIDVRLAQFSPTHILPIVMTNTS